MACGIVKLPLKVTFVSDKLVGESILVRLAESVLPYGPVKVAVVEAFLIPLGWETTNSKETLVFAAINSTSLGVKVKDSTVGRTFAWAVVGKRPKVRNSIIIVDLIFIT
jgi:hypothetical protein